MTFRWRGAVYFINSAAESWWSINDEAVDDRKADSSSYDT